MDDLFPRSAVPALHGYWAHGAVLMQLLCRPRIVTAKECGYTTKEPRLNKFYKKNSVT